MTNQRKTAVKTLIDRPDLAPRWVSQCVLLATTRRWRCCGGMG